MISCICRHIYLCLNIYYLLDSVDERNHVVVTWGILWRHIKLQNWIRKSHTISCLWALKHYNTEVSNVPAPDDTWEVVITPLWNVFPTGNWKPLEQLRWAALGSVTCWARHQIKLQTMAFWSFCKMHSYSELSPPLLSPASSLSLGRSYPGHFLFLLFPHFQCHHRRLLWLKAALQDECESRGEGPTVALLRTTVLTRRNRLH